MNHNHPRSSADLFIYESTPSRLNFRLHFPQGLPSLYTINFVKVTVTMCSITVVASIATKRRFLEHSEILPTLGYLGKLT